MINAQDNVVAFARLEHAVGVLHRRCQRLLAEYTLDSRVCRVHNNLSVAVVRDPDGDDIEWRLLLQHLFVQAVNGDQLTTTYYKC